MLNELKHGELHGPSIWHFYYLDDGFLMVIEVPDYIQATSVLPSKIHLTLQPPLNMDLLTAAVTLTVLR